MNTVLRRFGNSIGLVIPKALRETLHFDADQTVTVEQLDDGLLIKPTTPIKYTLEQLLSQCDLNAAQPVYDKAWEYIRPIGKEIW